MMKLSAAIAGVGLALLVLSAVPWPPAGQATTAPAAPTAVPTASAAADAAYGRALFTAKGCVQCHRHAEFAGSGKFSGGYGAENAPDLTNYPANPGFLRAWLKDPAAVRPGTRMPNLGLSDEEIEALIAFLSANRATTANP